MLSGEGNENDEKTTIGLTSKKTCITLFFTFLCRCLHDHNVKLPKTSSYTFYGGNVVPVAVHFFSLAHFHLGGS